MHYKTAAGIQKIANQLRALKKIARSNASIEAMVGPRPQNPAKIEQPKPRDFREKLEQGVKREDAFRKFLEDDERYFFNRRLAARMLKAPGRLSFWRYIDPRNIFGEEASVRRAAIHNDERLANTVMDKGELKPRDPNKPWVTPAYRERLGSDMLSVWPDSRTPWELEANIQNVTEKER